MQLPKRGGCAQHGPLRGDAPPAPRPLQGRREGPMLPGAGRATQAIAGLPQPGGQARHRGSVQAGLACPPAACKPSTGVPV
jgi:hypothetical protein